MIQGYFYGVSQSQLWHRKVAIPLLFHAVPLAAVAQGMAGLFPLD
jgi:hypothetical protein